MGISETPPLERVKPRKKQVLRRFEWVKEILTADDKTLFSRLFVALTQALSASPAQAGAKIAKNNLNHE